MLYFRFSIFVVCHPNITDSRRHSLIHLNTKNTTLWRPIRRIRHPCGVRSFRCGRVMYIWYLVIEGKNIQMELECVFFLSSPHSFVQSRAVKIMVPVPFLCLWGTHFTFHVRHAHIFQQTFDARRSITTMNCARTC